MTKCDRCGKESGNLFCGKCRALVRGEQPNIKFDKLIPLILWDIDKKCYRFGCTVRSCPCNFNGICATRHLTLESFKSLLHEFDGDNIITQVCG